MAGSCKVLVILAGLVVLTQGQYQKKSLNLSKKVGEVYLVDLYQPAGDNGLLGRRQEKVLPVHQLLVALQPEEDKKDEIEESQVINVEKSRDKRSPGRCHKCGGGGHGGGYRPGGGGHGGGHGGGSSGSWSQASASASSGSFGGGYGKYGK